MISELWYRIKFYAPIVMVFIAAAGTWYLSGCTEVGDTSPVATIQIERPMVDVSQLLHGQAQAGTPGTGIK